MDEALAVDGAAPPTPDAPAASSAPAYPRHWEADVVASDGGVVHLRPILPSDADAIVEFHSRLSERTRYLRYFGAYPHIPPRDLERLTVVDHHARVALVVLLGDEVIAVGCYEGTYGPDGTEVVGPAEVAFVVRDDHQSRGLGSILLEHLAAAARERGVRRFEAEVLAQNTQMMRVFRDAGFQVSREFDEGVLHLEFDVDPTERSLEVRDAREQCAEARSVHNVLHPRSVAVIGASTDPRKIGHGVLLHLLRGNFAGPVYPVNPGARSVRGVHAYAAVTEIPDDVDLAVVAVPAAGMSEVMDSCLGQGRQGTGRAQWRLRRRRPGRGERPAPARGGGPRARDAGGGPERARGREHRSAGPAQRHAGPGPAPGRPGGLLQPVRRAERHPARGGRRARAGPVDLRLGRQPRGPVGQRRAAVLADRSRHGRRAAVHGVVRQPAQVHPLGPPARAHEADRGGEERPLGATTPTTLASTVAPVDESRVQALFEHSGVIRVQNVAQMFDVAQLLAYQPLPAGGRVAVVGNSTTLNLLVVDELHGEDLVLAGDPVDAGATVSPEGLAAAVGAAGRSDDVDALVVVFVPLLAMSGTAHAEALREAVAGLGKPVVTTFLGTQGMLGELAVLDRELAVLDRDGVPVRGSVPSYPTPERAVEALRRAVHCGAPR